jgi:hypothetical protein
VGGKGGETRSRVQLDATRVIAVALTYSFHSIRHHYHFRLSMLLAGAATQDERIKEIIQGPGDVEWKYEMRRQCQEILPNLWLGPFLASKNLELLQSLSITHMCVSVTTL